MAKDFKAAYKTIMDEHFTPGLEVKFQAVWRWNTVRGINFGGIDFGH